MGKLALSILLVMSLIMVSCSDDDEGISWVESNFASINSLSSCEIVNLDDIDGEEDKDDFESYYDTFETALCSNPNELVRYAESLEDKGFTLFQLINATTLLPTGWQGATITRDGGDYEFLFYDETYTYGGHYLAVWGFGPIRPTASAVNSLPFAAPLDEGVYTGEDTKRRNIDLHIGSAFTRP